MYELGWGGGLSSIHSKYNVISSRILAFIMKGPGFIFSQPGSQVSEAERTTDFDSVPFSFRAPQNPSALPLSSRSGELSSLS